MEKNMRISSIWCAVFFLLVPLQGTLSDDPTCAEPPTVDLASLTSLAAPENPVNTVVTYTCQFGYVLDGPSRSATCKLTDYGDTAEWSDPGVTCIPRSCGDPGFVSNGRRQGSLFTFPNSVSYECDEGFRLQGGNGRRYCQASGTWSGKLPRCEVVICDTPKNPENGQVTYISLEFGSELKFECDSGYGLQYKTPVYCTSDGTWSETDVTCVEMPCETLQKPDHGSVEFIGMEGNPRAGTMAYFSCEEGRTLSGPTTSKCLSTGQWTFPTPECLEPCSIPYVPNGKIGKWTPQRSSNKQYFQAIRVGEKLKDDEKLFLHCDPGYRPLGITTNWQAMVTCKGGKWSDNPYCELSTCSSEPPEAKNGKVEKIDRKHGGTVLYVCLPDFEKVKGGNVNCNMGEWKGVPPICKDIRCYAQHISHHTGVAEISPVTQQGNEVKIRCLEGYEPRSNLPQCSNGDWTRNDESPCKEKGCSVPWILYGSIIERTVGPQKYNWWNWKWESKVTFKEVNVGSVPSKTATLFIACEERHSLQGTGATSARIQCSEGRWTPDPKCYETGRQNKITTERVSISSKSSISTTPLPPPRLTSESASSESPVVSGVAVEEEFEEKNIPTDSEEFKDACSCEYLTDANIVAHADEKEVKLHDRVKNGTVLKFRCEKVGYERLLGAKEISCVNCKPWSASDFPTCVKPERGETIIIFDSGLNVSIDGVLEVQKGKSLTLICTAMETAKFPKWSFPNVTGINISEELRERTGDFLYLSHLYIKNITSNYNGFYACAVNTEVPTVVELYVVDPDAHCSRFSLEDKELDVEYDAEDTRVGSRATFSCRKIGQKLNGTKVVKCLRSAEWSSPPPQCIDITCVKLEDTDLMTVSYTNYDRVIGSYANFHCFAPGIRSGVPRTECLENGEWKDPLPTCEMTPCPSASLSLNMPPEVKPTMDDMTNSTMPYNSKVELMCRDDKNIVGVPFAKCGDEGKWEFGDIQCISGCPPLEKAPGSRLTIKPNKEIYNIGEYVTLSCPTELIMSSELHRVMCLQGGWSAGALPECVEPDSV